MRLPVTALLETTLPARDLIALEPGDVLSLGHGATQPIDVHVGSVRRFSGRLTRKGGRRRCDGRVVCGSGVRPGRCCMTALSLNREFAGALVDELAIVVGAMIDAAASVVPGAPAMGRQWVAEIRASGGLDGTFTLVLDYDGTVAVTKLMTGIEGEVPAEALLDTLREVLAQAISALALKPVARGAKLSVARLDEQSDLVPEGEWGAHAIAAEELPTPLSLTVWGAVVRAAGGGSAGRGGRGARAGTGAGGAAARTVASKYCLTSISRSSSGSGRTELPLRQLTRLGLGSVIDLGRSPDDLGGSAGQQSCGGQRRSRGGVRQLRHPHSRRCEPA